MAKRPKTADVIEDVFAAGCAAVSLCCEFLLAGKGLSFDEKVPLSQHF